ncbi:MAG: hypothetical protein JWP97_222 [Labilithrix sp.]|nr:hypothetical protein [Labilithrix sp.]
MRSGGAGLGLPEVPFGAVVGGDFMVVRSLSRGSMGSLYIAEQLSTARHRALKLLRREYVSDETLYKRFEREAQMAAKIPSEHVVQIIASGVDERLQAPWIAMELLEGQHLGDHVQEAGFLPPEEVRVIFEQLCHAISAGHQLGIVHRDLKPANIFLSETKRVGAERMVKVLDFGVARIMAENLTVSGAPLGTPSWMSPEQAKGEPISTATDVWALGLIAFYMLTGLPFWHASQRPGQEMQVIREILEGSVPIASTRALELGAAGRIPRGFDEWFAQAMARHPQERFTNATAANVALSHTLRR